VETVGIRQVMWFVMLESANEKLSGQFLGLIVMSH
jgi:hypothetical protein